NRACWGAGCRSIAAMACSVPLRPGPSNQPTSFCKPCPTMRPPTTVRRTTLPILTVSSYLLQFSSDEGCALCQCAELTERGRAGQILHPAVGGGNQAIRAHHLQCRLDAPGHLLVT